MRVAVCFSGLPRLDAWSAITSWQRFISANQADVFVHTWCDDTNQYQSLMTRMNGQLAPRAVIMEPSVDLPVAQYTERIWPTASPYRMLSGFTSIHRCFDLAQSWANHTSTTWDYVVRARFDVEIEPFELQPAFGVVVHDDPDKLILKFTYRGQPMWGINDLVAYGAPDAMAAYARTDELMPSLYADEGVDVCPEIFLTASLTRQNTPITFRQMPNRIVRAQ